MRVRTGLDVWEAEQFRALRGLKVGAIVNPTSVDGRFRHGLGDEPLLASSAILKLLPSRAMVTKS